MADMTSSKNGFGDVWPDGSTELVWDVKEPFLTSDQLERYLFGIPLVSQLLDPLARTYDKATPEFLKDIIVGAAATFEEDAGCHVFPQTKTERHPFHVIDWNSGFGKFELRKRPIASIEALKIMSSDNISFFTVPTAWIETGYLHQGIIHILPLSPASAASTVLSIIGGGPAAAIFFTSLARMSYIPAYFTIDYTVGFPDGMIPRYINDTIGKIAAIEVLSMLATTFTKNSQSLGLDALSQSSSLPGPQIWDGRIKFLQDQVDKRIRKTKKKTGQSMIVSSI